MSLRVVGAGLGRTGTHSLKQALEQLLDAPCYHMVEVFGRPDDIAVWQRAVNADPPDWRTFLADFGAAVDWPVAAFWAELSAAFPDAVVLLSTRDTEGWWTSASHTIFDAITRAVPAGEAMLASQQAMIISLLDRTFTPGWRNEADAKAAYEAHNRAVRAAVPADRLLDWRPGDGWGPICAALDLPVPSDPFPHVNTTNDFRAMARLDEPR
ncbi:MAG TPA: sulfotransferase [Acidimicrobiia bacterium]|nr:sulfotransferase [Acidimicrobiia bacterium]